MAPRSMAAVAPALPWRTRGAGVPPRTELRGSSHALIAQARGLLADSVAAEAAGERFCLAHVAALRIAAAVFAARGRPPGTRRRLVSAWVLVDTVAPEFADWAAYFAAAAPARAAVEAGAVSAVSHRSADEQVQAATEFLHVVETSLGMLSPALAS